MLFRSADWVLSRTGFEGQQTNEKASPDRKDNVWEPVHEDRGAYGGFKNIATNKSFTLWAGMHRTAVRIAAGAAVIGLVALLAGKKD